MRTGAMRTNVLTSLVVGGLAASAWAQHEPKPAPDEGQILPDGLSCVVKITCDPALLPLTQESVLALMQSSYVAGEALKQAFEIPYPDPGQYQYEIEFKPLAGGVTQAPAGPGLMMGMMGGALRQPPQTGGVFVPVPQGGLGGMEGYGGMMGGMGGYGGSGGSGGGGGGDGVGSGAPTPGGLGGGGGASPAEGLLPAMPGAPSGGPMTPGGVAPPRFPGMVAPSGQPAMFDIMVPAPRESSLVGELQVSIENASPSRHEAFLRAICERLQGALNGLWEKEMTSIDRQLAMSREEQARAEKKLRELQQQRRDLLAAGQGDLMPEAVMDQIRRLGMERQRMEMDLLGQQARLKALQQQIQATSERILDVSRDDAMIKPLQEKLQQLRRQLEMVQQQHEKGLVPESEVQKVRIALSEGEVQLAEARRKVAQAGGGEVLGRLNEELAMLSVNTAETEVRLKYIREQMEKNKQLAGAADEYEMQISMAMPYARRAYESSKLRVEELEQRMRMAVPPMVTVIGGAASKPAK